MAEVIKKGYFHSSFLREVQWSPEK